MNKKDLKEILSTIDMSSVGSLWGEHGLELKLKEIMDVSKIKQIDLEIFNILEQINAKNVRPDREIELQYVVIFIKNKMNISNYSDIKLDALIHLPKEIIENEKFLDKFISLVIDNTDQEISFTEQYAELPLGLRSNQKIAINLFDYLSAEIGSKNANAYFYGTGVDYVAPKLLRNKDFIKKVMQVNPKIIFGDKFSNIKAKFAPKYIKEICNDREFLDEMREAANSMEYEGASYIFLITDPKNVKISDIMAAVKEKAYAVINRKEIKNRFIGVSELVAVMKEVDCKIDFKYQPFGDAFSFSPKTRLEMEEMVKDYTF